MGIPTLAFEVRTLMRSDIVFLRSSSTSGDTLEKKLMICHWQTQDQPLIFLYMMENNPFTKNTCLLLILSLSITPSND